MIVSAVSTAIVLAGCAKEQIAGQAISDGEIITATAVIPGPCQTKVAYTDTFESKDDIVDIKAAWEIGDTFTALEINNGKITEVTFTATAVVGKTATFAAKNAEAANDNTKWLAVFGNVKYSGGAFCCGYDGQDGSLKNLSKYDYSVANATGTAPEFNFSKGQRLTYVMRIMLPAGIKSMEFNTGETNNGGWTVSNDGKARGTVSCPSKASVKTVTLASESTAGQVAYLAIPAISYQVTESADKNRLAGLIITIFSSDLKASQGKTFSQELSVSGGCMGTFDMSRLKLLARPLASDAIRMGSVSANGKSYPLGSWAPFNLGATGFPTSDSAIIGGMYAWGETESKTAFSKDGYKYYVSGTYNSQIGNKYENTVEGGEPYNYVSPSGTSTLRNGPGVFYDIRGTKYDAARVKWGSEWCLPSNKVVCNLCEMAGPYLNETDANGAIEYVFHAPGSYENPYGFTSRLGACVVKANGRELPFYMVPFSSEGSIDNSGTLSRYQTATSDYGVYESGVFKKYWNRSCQLRMDSNNSFYVNNNSYQWDGLAIKPILNED